MLKNQLHQFCINYINERMASSQAAIAAAQSAANEEGKSSAGDKYETGRAMMQLEIEKNTSQLLQAKQLSQLLEHINPLIVHQSIQQGSLIITSQGNYYIAIGAGLVNIENEAYYLISIASPIGAILKGKKGNDAFEFNGEKVKIIAVL